MRPVVDLNLTRLLRQIYATPRHLALQIWTDEETVQRMTLTFEIKRAERRYAAHRALTCNSRYGKKTR